MNDTKNFPENIKNHIIVTIKNNLNFFSNHNNTTELFA